ncbi:MAG: hypothetical protein KME01_16490 [Chroococcus sp. CMT-3BRIN-NPC107]|nr:hypothetical protein [Chroococcus sp. CMT-3BRIN-NPC107]
MAGDAIAQIVQVYVKRANGILDSLEVTDSSDRPVLDEDFLSGLIWQSMTMDLSDLMEEFAFDDVESSPVSIGSQVEPIDRKEARAIAPGTALRAIARKERAAMGKALKDLAQKENIPKWQSVISHWMQQHGGKKVSLWQLQQALGMPIVGFWRLAAAFPHPLSLE